MIWSNYCVAFNSPLIDSIVFLEPDTSQLDPRLEVIDNQDTAICFTIDDSKSLAKKLSFMTYCDTIMRVQDSIITHQNVIISKRNIQLIKMNQQVEDYEKLYENSKFLADAHSSSTDYIIRENKRIHRDNLILKVVSGVLATGLILKN